MKISVVTIVRNDHAHIEETLNSVLEQRGEGFELEYVVIDGASDDGTAEIVARYAGRLAFFVSEKDSGIYNAMNKGIAHCTGDVIGMINSGDRYLPGALALVAKSFADYGKLDRIFWGDVLYRHLGLVRGFREKNRYLGAFAPHSSMFVPRNIYETIGRYDESFGLLGDYEFMYRAVNVEKIAPLYVPQPVAFYLEDGLSDRHVYRCLKDELTVKLRYGQNHLTARLIFLLKVIKNVPRILKNFFC
ncbi:MAG: glycosyltransferase [Lentisphaeria bacterium]|nr:glycosyltransferase [Lentisphaeria bacterium]